MINMYQFTRNRFSYFLLTAFIVLAASTLHGQVPDSTKRTDSIQIVDTAAKQEPVSIKKHSPRKAAIRSAVIPGWGQVYNKKYWKVPIIYAGLGITAGIFIYNLESYKDTKFAYRVKYNMRVYHTDSASYDQIKDYLKPLSEESLRYYRNQYRRDIDYATIFFLIVWGLNVVDATVDAHLKGFDVGPDLGLRIKPGYSEMAGTSGLSLVLSYKDKSSR
jgi:hypothetical protein